MLTLNRSPQACLSLLMGGLISGLLVLETPAMPRIGEPAPEFTVEDTHGEEISLRDLEGQIVVLEWTNHQCPFVGKHYGSGNMQALQKEADEQGVMWISIISSAPGQEGSVTAEQANELTVSREAAPNAVILDPTGEIGKLYGARATPHMFVIDEQGTLQYMGAIDSIPTAQISDIESAENYVRTALDQVMAGEPVSTPATRAYGCIIKYAS